MANIKENDWLVARINNSEYSIQDFKNIGMTSENTQLLDREDYKKSQYIQDKFTDETGKFNEVVFNKVYDYAAALFKNFTDSQYEDTFFKELAYDPYDSFRPNESKLKLPTLVFDRVTNPQHIKSGISRIGFTDKPEVSDLSIAESSKVYNWKEKKFENFTPNDLALFESPVNFIKSLASPLVLATWDSDGTHTDPWTGRSVKHRKGLAKTNSDGLYYYETLDGRDTYGKKFRTVLDNITSENSAINAYDFFDSNDLDKSATGIAFKLAAQIAPLFITGVGEIYGVALLGSTLLDVLPNLYKSSVGVFYDNDDIEKIMNNIQGFGKTLKSGMSEYGQKHMFGIESIANIVSDVALLWAYLRSIFKGVNKMLGTEAKILESETQTINLARNSTAVLREMITSALLGREFDSDTYKRALDAARIVQQSKLAPILKANNRTAANVALGYMAMLQGLEVYLDALSQGATKKQAALWTWGTVAGMYVVDRTGLGEVFFPELKEGASSIYKKLIFNVGEAINQGFKNVKSTIKENNPKALAQFFVKGRSAASGFWKDIQSHSTTFIEKALGEGLEEVAEELVIDLMKSTNNAFIDLGWAPKEWTKLNAFENAGERYIGNFLGGFIGGMVFAGVDLHQNSKNSEQTNLELIYLIRNGKLNDIKEELTKLRDKGLLGNKNLSSTKYLEITDDLGNKQSVWSTGTAEDNQNDATYRMILDYLNALEKAIYTDGLDLNDALVIDKILRGDERIKSLLSFDEEGSLMLKGYMGTFLLDWQNVCSAILKNDGKLQNLESKYGINERKSEAYLKELADIQEERKELLEKRDKFLDGTYSVYYLGQTLFNINSEVNKYFFTPKFSLFAEFMYKRPYQELSPSEISEARKEYEQFTSKRKIEKADKAYQLFDMYSKRLAEQLGKEGEKYEDFHKYREFILSNFTKHTLSIDDEGNVLEKLPLEVASEELLLHNLEEAGRAIKGPDGFTTFELPSSKFLILDIPGRLQIGQDADGKPIYETAELYNERILPIKDANARAEKNIEKLINKIKETGYIDEEVKSFLLNHLNFYENINRIIGSNFSESGYNEFFKESLKRLEDIKDLNSAKDIINELQLNADTYVNSKLEEILKFVTSEELWEADSETGALVNQTLDLILNKLVLKDEELDQTAIDVIKLYYLGQYKLSLSDIKEEILKNQAIKLGSIVLNLKSDPLRTLLQTVSVDTFGKHLGIFDVLSREDLHLRNSLALADYTASKEADSEIELALAILNMTDAVITASSTDSENYGHNAILNDFILKYNYRLDLYGILKDSNVASLLEGILERRQQIQFLKDLAYYNKANLFAELLRVGMKTMKILANNLLSKLKLPNGIISIEGISLTDGLDNIDRSAFLDENEDSAKLLANYTKLTSLIYLNFLKMIRKSTKTKYEVLLDLLLNFKNIYNEQILVDLETSKINSSILSITDYDSLMHLISILTLDRAKFNQYLYNILTLEDIKFAPLCNLLLSAFMLTAQFLDTEMFNTVFKMIYGKKYLPNTGYIDGMGGAGKTSVVAYLVLEICKQLDPKYVSWKVGPTLNLVQNLTDSLGSEGESMTTDELLKTLLGEQAYNTLEIAISKNEKDCDLYTVGKSASDITIKDFQYAELAKVPSVIFIDEATYIDSVKHNIISYVANKLGIQIINIGDLNLNGAELTDIGVYNLENRSVSMLRTPRLEISMRITNTLKKDNIDSILQGLYKSDAQTLVRDIIYNSPDMKMLDASRKAIQQALDNWGHLKLEYQMHYYEDDHTFNGEKLVTSINVEDIDRLLKLPSSDGKPVTLGIIYDSVDSDTYKIAKLYKENHPEAALKLFTPKEVLGSECTYTIIDVQYKVEDSDWASAYKFLKNFYTLITRSKKGTLLIDSTNSLSSIFKKGSIKDATTGESPDPSIIIEKFKDLFIKDLEYALQEAPSNIASTNSGGNGNGSQGSSGDSETGGSTSGTGDLGLGNGNQGDNLQGNGEQGNGNQGTSRGPNQGGHFADSPTVIPGDKSEFDSLGSGNIDVADTSSNDSLLDGLSTSSFDDGVIDQGAYSNPLAEVENVVGGVIRNVRSYAWYLRPGCVVKETDKGKRYVKEESGHGLPVVDDLKIFMIDGQEYTESSILGCIKALDILREVIQSKIFLNFKNNEDLNKLLYAKIKEVLDNKRISLFFNKLDLLGGTFALRIKGYDEKTDKCLWKQGYDANKEKGNGTSYNIVYKFKGLNGADCEVTIGTLPNPETWKNYLNSMTEDEKAVRGAVSDDTVKAYEKWYNDHAIKSGNDLDVRYYEIPANDISPMESTRITRTLDSDKKVVKFDGALFQKMYPRALVSSPFIFSGDTKEDNPYLSESLYKRLAGKAIAFVCTSPVAAELYFKSKNNGVVSFTADNLRYWYEYQSKNNLPPFIRIVRLDPKSVYTFDSKDPFDPTVQRPGYLSTFMNLKGKDLGSILETFGSITTAIKVFEALWTYRGSLLKFTTILDSLKDSDLTEKDLILEVNNRARLLLLLFILMPESDSTNSNATNYMSGPLADHIDSFKIPRTNPDGSEGYFYGVKLTAEGARMLRDFLNEVLHYALYVFPDFEKLSPDTKIYSIPKKGSSEKTVLGVAQSIWLQIKNGNTLAKIRIQDKDKKVLDIVFDTTYKELFLIILSRLINIALNNVKSDLNFILDLAQKVNGEIATHIVYDLNSEIAPYPKVLNAIFENIKGGSAGRINFVKGTLNLILHGLVSPTAIAHNGYRSFAPFPQGYLFHSRYNKKNNKTSPLGNFYPAEGSLEDYILDFIIERGNMEVNLPTGQMKSLEQSVEITKQLDLNKLVDKYKNLNFDNDTMQKLQEILREAELSYLDKGDNLYHSIITDMKNKIEHIIRIKLEDKTLTTSNGDIVLDFDTINLTPITLVLVLQLVKPGITKDLYSCRYSENKKFIVVQYISDNNGGGSKYSYNKATRELKLEAEVNPEYHPLGNPVLPVQPTQSTQEIDNLVEKVLTDYNTLLDNDENDEFIDEILNLITKSLGIARGKEKKNFRDNFGKNDELETLNKLLKEITDFLGPESTDNTENTEGTGLSDDILDDINNNTGDSTTSDANISESRLNGYSAKDLNFIKELIEDMITLANSLNSKDINGKSTIDEELTCKNTNVT